MDTSGEANMAEIAPTGGAEPEQTFALDPSGRLVLHFRNSGWVVPAEEVPRLAALLSGSPTPSGAEAGLREMLAKRLRELADRDEDVMLEVRVAVAGGWETRAGFIDMFDLLKLLSPLAPNGEKE